MNVVQLLIDAIPFTLVCIGIAFVWTLISGSRLSLISFASVSTVTFLSVLLLIWFFRDGIGPDAVTSTGFEMARRIGIGAAFPAACWLLLNGLAFFRYRSRLKGAA